MLLLSASCEDGINFVHKHNGWFPVNRQLEQLAGLDNSHMNNSQSNHHECVCVCLVQTIFSLSPTHLDIKLDAEIEKKFIPDTDDSTFAMKDLPVPGGPYNRIPFHGFLFPVNSCGNFCGRMTASSSDCLASSNPATSFHDSSFDGGTSVSSSFRRISFCSGVMFSSSSCRFCSRSSSVMSFSCFLVLSPVLGPAAALAAGGFFLFFSTMSLKVSARVMIVWHALLSFSAQSFLSCIHIPVA